MEGFRDAVVERERQADTERAAIEQRATRQTRLEGLTHEFDASITSLMDQVQAMTGRLNDAASSMSDSVERAKRESAGVVAATEQSNASVATAANASSELLDSIRDIAGRSRARPRSRVRRSTTPRPPICASRVGRCGRAHRCCRPADQPDRQPDQPAGAQRDDRGGARRRRRQGLRGGRQRGQESRQPDRARD